MAQSGDQSWLKLRDGLTVSQLIDVLRQLFRRIFKRLDDLDVRGSGFVVSANSVNTAAIQDDAVTAAKIAGTAVGAGLTGGGGSAIAVNADGSTLEVSGGAVQVKNSGVTDGKLASSYLYADGTRPATFLTLTDTTVDPGAVANGRVYYTSGTWDPGGGAGVYARIGGAWAKLN